MNDIANADIISLNRSFILIAISQFVELIPQAFLFNKNIDS